MKPDGEKRSRCHRAMPANRNAGWQRVKVGRRKCSKHAEEGGGKCSSSKAAEEKVGLGQLVRWTVTCWDLCNQSNQRFRPRQISTTRPGSLCALRLCRRAHGDTELPTATRTVLSLSPSIGEGFGETVSAPSILWWLVAGGWWPVIGARCANVRVDNPEFVQVALSPRSTSVPAFDQFYRSGANRATEIEDGPDRRPPHLHTPAYGPT